MQRFAGFRLAIARQGGRRTWITQYRVNGRQRRVTIGSADLLTVEQARVAARKILASVVLGDDPQGERRRKREVARVTLRSVVDDYLRSRAGRLRPRTEFEIRRYLTGPYFRPLHATPIEKIERQAVAAQIMRIERESGVATATAARSALSAMFVWGMKTGIVERNPLIGCYAPATPPSRDRVLSDSELVAIWRACGDDALGRITRLLILTGQRRSEIGGMSWGELDRERETWTLPAGRSKNGRAHVLPLPPGAWAIIESVPHWIDRDLLFGDRGDRGFAGWHQAKRALDRRLGDAVKAWTLHDLRRSTATKMADLGIAPHVVEQILNHRSGHRRGPAGIYNRSVYEREVAAALALWSDDLRALVEGGERRVLIMRSSA